MKPVSSRSAQELLDAYRAKDLSPVEVVNSTLQAIDQSSLNAFWRVDAERAIAAAKISEQRFAEGTPRALEGIPVGVKDIIDTAGLITTSGSAMFAERVPEVDAEVVRALREAGAIVIGKTATHEFAYGLTTVNPHFGTTHHPTHPGHIVGGSSGGSAAAVASGLVPLALGSDTSVSVREPAVFCGCVGFRPTHDSMSLHGVTPLAPSFDTVGPMATTVDDAWRMAEVMWTHSPGLAGQPESVAFDVPLGPLRIGVMAEDWSITPIPEMLAAVAAARDVLEQLGHCATATIIEGFQIAPDTFTYAMLPESLETHRRLGLWPQRHGEYGDDVAIRLRGAEAVSLDTHLGAVADRRMLRTRMNAFFQSFDVLLTPASAITAPTIEDRDAPVHNGQKYTIRDLLFPFQVMAPLCGLPALALPVGHDATGLPTSVMLNAAPRKDRVLLRLGSQLMKELT